MTDRKSGVERLGLFSPENPLPRPSPSPPAPPGWHALPLPLLVPSPISSPRYRAYAVLVLVGRQTPRLRLRPLLTTLITTVRRSFLSRPDPVADVRVARTALVKTRRRRAVSMSRDNGHAESLIVSGRRKRVTDAAARVEKKKSSSVDRPRLLRRFLRQRRHTVVLSRRPVRLGLAGDGFRRELRSDRSSLVGTDPTRYEIDCPLRLLYSTQPV